MTAIIQIFELFTNLMVTIILVQVVVSLLLMFNVISMQNQYVASLYQGLNVLLEPFLKPIRKIMPDTGAFDFSPIVLIFGLQVVIIILKNIAMSL